MQHAKIMLFLSLLWLSQQAHGLNLTPVVIDSDFEAYNIARSSRFLADPRQSLQLEHILSGRLDNRFQQVDREIPSFGFTSFAYWFQFEIINNRDENLDWLLGIEYPMLDRIDLFHQDAAGDWQQRYAGDHFPFDQREIKHRFFYFNVNFAPGEIRRFVLRVQTDGSAEIPIVLKSPAQLRLDDHTDQLMQGMFIGFLGILALYNLILFIGSKKAEYIFYSMFLLSIALFKSTMNGLTFEYLWPSFPWWANQAAYFTPPFTFFAAVLYTYKFLQFDQFPRYKFIYLVTIATLGTVCFISLFAPGKFTMVSILFGLAASILMLVSSAHRTYQGYKPAKYYLFAWLALIVGSLIYGIQKLGVIPVSFITLYGVEFSAGVQVVLLSLGQSEKINSYHKQIRRAQKKALDSQRKINRMTEEMNQNLERMVNEKTRDIRVILHHIKQGIFTIDQNGDITGDHSDELVKIIGKKHLDRKNLGQALLSRSQLDQDQQSQILTVLMSSVGQDDFNFEANLHLLPTRLEIARGSGNQILEIEWTPILAEDDIIEKIMVTIRDITEIQKWQQLQAEHDHEEKIMNQILKIDALRFKSFHESSKAMAQECLAVSKVQLDSQWTKILRNIHTIKGNSRTYGFTDLSDQLHHLEDSIKSASSEVDLQGQRFDVIQDGLAKCIQILDGYRDINDRKLERHIVGELEELAIQSFHLIEDLEQSQLLNQHPDREKFLDLALSLSRYARLPLEAVLEPVMKSMPSICRDLNKPAPVIHFSGAQLQIDKNYSHILENVFTHLIRNSIDHGFSNQPNPKINIHCAELTDFFQIHYKDNGRGLDIEGLRTKGYRQKLVDDNATVEQIAELIFSSGFSSRENVTNLSGRGVGMDAIRSFLREMGGDISIKLGLKTSSGFQKFHFELQVPKEFHQQAVQNTSASSLRLIPLNQAQRK